MLATLAKNDRVVVPLGLLTVTALSWAYVLSGAGMGTDMGVGATMPMDAMAGMNMPMPDASWTLEYWLLMLVMWWVMMIAMMLPSAAPMILLFATANSRTPAPVPTAVFATGYLLVWTGFGALATTLQWGLGSVGQMDAMMRTTSVGLNAALLIAAGLYQFTPVKNACLRHCRSPMQFVMLHWLPGQYGALRMGVRHGTYCLGCCWFLMALLFFGGVMNLFWIGGLALYVLIEKLVPRGDLVGRIAGGGLVLWGALLLTGTVGP